MPGQVPTSHALRRQSLYNEVLRLYIDEDLRRSVIADRLGISAKRVCKIIREAQLAGGQVYEERSGQALMLELKRLRRAKFDAFQIVHSECPACGGSGCPRCLDRSGMAHSGGERMEAMGPYLRAIEAEESLIGDSRRAADNRLEVTAATRRVLAKMGNVMKEDVETMLDDYAVSLSSLVARALNGQPTELPQLAQQIREEFAKMLAQTASTPAASISGDETKLGRVDITGERSTL